MIIVMLDTVIVEIIAANGTAVCAGKLAAAGKKIVFSGLFWKSTRIPLGVRSVLRTICRGTSVVAVGPCCSLPSIMPRRGMRWAAIAASQRAGKRLAALLELRASRGGW